MEVGNRAAVGFAKAVVNGDRFLAEVRGGQQINLQECKNRLYCSTNLLKLAQKSVYLLATDRRILLAEFKTRPSSVVPQGRLNHLLAFFVKQMEAGEIELQI